MEWLVSAIEKMIAIPLDDAVGFFFCVFAGVLVNWIWKCKKEGIKLSSYWLDDLKSTAGVFAGAFATFLTAIILEPGLTKATYFAIGIAADSLIGRPPMPLDVRTALARLQMSEDNANSPTLVDADGNGLPKSTDVGSSTVDAIAKIERTYVSGVPTGKADPNSGAS